MTDLKELIEQEIDQYLEWPTADKSHVTTVSAKLFAEHAARLYADHIAEDRKKVSRPQIREAFMRNGARIEPDRDDLPDYVYESVFELLEMAAPAVQQPAPDVAHMADALEAVVSYHAEVYDSDKPLMANYSEMMRKVRGALAAHRKQQEPSHDNQ